MKTWIKISCSYL